MTRIEKMMQIAKDNGVKAVVKEVGGNIFASINGQTVKVSGFASFDAKCRELKDYIAPAPINLTSKIARIEEAVLSNYDNYRD